MYNYISNKWKALNNKTLHIHEETIGEIPKKFQGLQVITSMLIDMVSLIRMTRNNQRDQSQEVLVDLVDIITIIAKIIIEALKFTQTVERTGQMITIKHIHVIKITKIQKEAQEVEIEISHKEKEETIETVIRGAEETDEASEVNTHQGQDLNLITEEKGAHPGLLAVICKLERIETHFNNQQLQGTKVQG